MNIFSSLISDQFVFPAFQFSFVLLAFYAWAKHRAGFTPEDSLSRKVKRGNESWDNFALAYGVLALIFLQAINSTEALKGYKSIVTIIDLFLEVVRQI